MKRLNQPVIKTVMTNKTFFEMITKASHVKKEELITIKMNYCNRNNGYNYRSKYNDNYKAIIDTITSEVVTEINI